jgi:putative ABC transport system permease protein
MIPSLDIAPILRSMRHHKGAFSLLVLEVALGFVMMTHTLVSMRYYHRLHVQAMGMPDDKLVVARRRFLHPRDITVAQALQRADLAALGGTGAPVAAMDSAPMPDAAAFPVRLTRPNAPRETFAWMVHATPGVTSTLGLRTIAGAGLQAREVAADGARGEAQLLLTATTAERLFGTIDDAVGKPLDGATFGRGRVAGVVADFWFRGWVPAATSIAIVGAEPVTEHEIVYVLRAHGADRAPLVQAASAALAAAGDADSTIVVNALDRSATRFSLLSGGAVVILVWTGFLVIAVALSGSLALASFSVAERTRQIGVRRALGADRGQIVSYFLLENLILTTFGLALGLGLTIGLNHTLRRIMADLRLTSDEVLISMLIFILTGLLSALVPARRAALIPPWAATRTL